MSMPKEMTQRLLELAGLHPTTEQVEATTRLHNLLMEQMASVPAELLENVEPHYIQPHRREQPRR